MDINYELCYATQHALIILEVKPGQNTSTVENWQTCFVNLFMSLAWTVDSGTQKRGPPPSEGSRLLRSGMEREAEGQTDKKAQLPDSFAWRKGFNFKETEL